MRSMTSFDGGTSFEGGHSCAACVAVSALKWMIVLQNMNSLNVQKLDQSFVVDQRVSPPGILDLIISTLISQSDGCVTTPVHTIFRSRLMIHLLIFRHPTRMARALILQNPNFKSEGQWTSIHFFDMIIEQSLSEKPNSGQ